MSAVAPDRWSVSSPWVFRNTEYKVSADVRDDVLVVQVEDFLAADQWTGHFEAKHIEELTRKTGNFKQFPIFLNMLESAITKSSDSVTLDLLTYADLESLRNKKHESGRGFSPKSKQSQSKRYLILTYSVEFDRIHYPLALPYSGQPDPVQLQQTIRLLRTELERSKKQATHGHKHAELARLRRDCESLAQEKEELEEVLATFKQDIALSSKETVNKEMKILKKVVKNLEEELLKERSKHQKYTNKKNEELRTLLHELEELRLSERTLRTRAKSLANELAVLKHGLRTSPASYTSSKKHSQKKRRSTSTDRGTRRTSLSDERKYRTRLSTGRQTGQLRTPSPSGARVPRFDPTAYIESKKKKQQNADLRLGRLKVSVRPRVPRSRSNSRERFQKPPSGSHERSGGNPSTRYRSASRDSSRASSRRSSVSSNHSDIVVISGGGKRKSVSSVRRPKLAWGSPQLVPKSTTPISTQAKTPGTHNNSSMLDHSAEISEIDARLNALQQFMKRSLETTKSYSNR